MRVPVTGSPILGQRGDASGPRRGTGDRRRGRWRCPGGRVEPGGSVLAARRGPESRQGPAVSIRDVIGLSRRRSRALRPSTTRWLTSPLDAEQAAARPGEATAAQRQRSLASDPRPPRHGVSGPRVARLPRARLPGAPRRSVFRVAGAGGPALDRGLPVLRALRSLQPLRHGGASAHRERGGHRHPADPSGVLVRRDPRAGLGGGVPRDRPVPRDHGATGDAVAGAPAERSRRRGARHPRHRRLPTTR